MSDVIMTPVAYAYFFPQNFPKCVFLVFGSAQLSRNHRNVNFKATRVKYRPFLKPTFFAIFKAFLL